MELKLSTTHICTECGYEIESGLMNTVRHSEDCKHNAPNEDIGSHESTVKSDKKKRKKEVAFKPIFKRMTQNEQIQLAMLSMAGSCIRGNIILMGLQSFNRVCNYKSKMIKKYLKKLWTFILVR